MSVSRLAVVILAMTLVQCEIFLDDPPDCETSMQAFYETCTYVLYDEPVSVQDAVGLCNDAAEDATDTGCIDEHMAWRVCLYRTEPETCGCDEALVDLYNCINAGYSEQTDERSDEGFK